MKILVVDDEERFAKLVAEHLTDAGHEVQAVTSGEEAIKRIGPGSFDVVVTDLRMMPVDGMQVLQAVKKISPETEVVMMTAYADVERAVEAMKLGAYHFADKGFSLDELVLMLERVGERRQLLAENRALKQELEQADRFGEMKGTSAGLKKVRDLVAKVGPSDTTVLILGESGVGKELVARMIHRKSLRASRLFVAVHTAALPDTLLESELFGYERGAFTGATGRKPGRLETSQGGTLFLDEIGEISAAFQVKLLRFMQEKQFVRLGGSQTITVDTRIVAATNRNLLEEVANGRFRDDLYYRLSVFPIEVPPLRERREDIVVLTGHILKRLGYNREPGKAVMNLLCSHDWPGNVRELENVLERALILASGDEIGPQHIQLPEPVLGKRGAMNDERRVSTQHSALSIQHSAGPLHRMEREMLEEAMRKAGGNKSKAAKLLGITRRMLYTKLTRFGIEHEGE